VAPLLESALILWPTCRLSSRNYCFIFNRPTHW